MSAPPDSTLANPAQIIADLPRELTQHTAEREELITERDVAYRRLDEAQAREIATAEVLQVINPSPGDLAPVFNAIREKALHLCDAAFGALSIFDDGKIHMVASRRLPPALANFLREPRPPAPGGRWDRTVRSENLIHIPDLATDLVGASQNPTRRAFVELGGVRAICI